jgi:hypothetical protein
VAYVIIMPSTYPVEFGPALDADVARVRAHAERPVNIYRPGPGVRSPGDDPQFVFTTGPYRAVYSLVAASGIDCMRYLSISDRRGGYPDLSVGLTLAHRVGFTGATPDVQGVVDSGRRPEDWVYFEDADEGTLVVQQIMRI